MLSTRLSWPSFSCNGKTQATNRYLICLSFISASQPTQTIFAISAPLYPISRKAWLGAMSRFSTLCRKKLTYCTSVRQREHKKCCQLVFWTRLTSVVHARRAYTPFLLAVKTSYPLVGSGSPKRISTPSKLDGSHFLLYPTETQKVPFGCLFSKRACKGTAFL